MPLTDGYGVAIGTKHHYYRDPVNNYGQYFHANVELATPAGIYKCAIDVDSKHQQHGVEWRVLTLDDEQLKGVASMTPGWHSLVSNNSSGALDYLREPALMTAASAWSSGTSVDALSELEPILAKAELLLVFGEPFSNGLGVHNIHQNQGDPEGSAWWQENGIWQSGATIARQPDGRWLAFLNKFKPQANKTDSAGHPI